MASLDVLTLSETLILPSTGKMDVKEDTYEQKTKSVKQFAP